MIFMSDATLASTSTRARPNAFNFLHQLERKVMLGGIMFEAVHQLTTPKICKKVYGLGDQEAGAVVNLACNMPKEVVHAYAAAVAKYGMVRGPITHGGLASSSITIGWQPELSDARWSSDMKNEASTIMLMCQRNLKDYDELPVGLRKSAGVHDIEQLQLICRALELSLMALKSVISDSTLQKHKPALQEAFMLKVLDSALLKAVDECPRPWDVCTLPEFCNVVASEKAEVEAKSLERSAELQLQVAAATFAQMKQQIRDDKEAVQQFLMHKKKMLENWQHTIMTFRRRRYTTGLKRVREMMPQRLNFVSVDPGSALALVAETRAKFTQAVPEATGNMPWPQFLFFLRSRSTHLRTSTLYKMLLCLALNRFMLW